MLLLEGPIISNTSDIPIFPIPDGTLGPIRVPPCPTGQTCDNVNTNETLPQIAAGYSYAPGYHRLLFKLVVDNGYTIYKHNFCIPQSSS